MKEPKEKIEWDKKKIILFVIFFVLLLVGLGALKVMVLDKNSLQDKNSSVVSSQEVKAAETSSLNAQTIKNNIQGQIKSLKDEANNIDVVSIATSSPQVQKIINDLKALQNYPSNQLKETCVNICNRL